ncbi:MAG: HAMP domain-containing protein [Desulfuromonadales bacterium]|nr:MAG: HAMP domain-containing protein [Desulfuromonadales bacterium]
MSSTSGSRRSAPRRHATLSITARLTILYTLATVAILLFAIAFQFLALVNDLIYEDNEFLSDKIRVIRAIIARNPGDDARLEQEIQFDVITREHLRYLVRILDKEGRVLAETTGMGRLAAAAAFPQPARSGGGIGQGVKRAAPDDRVFLLNAGWAAAGNDERYRLIQVALDISDEEDLLEGYRQKMAFVFLSGVCLSAVLSMVIARRGLRPLAEIAETAGRVTVESLHERVGTRRWPRELDRVADAFDGMLARLEASFTRLAEFSANLSHELRTPLNNLRGEAEVTLSRPRSAEEYRRIIESGTEEYERLSRMIDDILFLARAEQQAEPADIDAGHELEQLCDYYGTLAEEQGITLHRQGEGALRADASLFQRAVGNLLSNAIRYTPAGGTITVSLTRADDGATRLTVADTGIGISPEELPLVFDRFHRSDRARALHGHGSGLGLSIVRSIMELHGGNVAIESTPDRGTVVTLRFPTSA